MFDSTVITGYGVISALGKGKAENSKKLFSGKCGITDISFEYVDKTILSPFGAITFDLTVDPFFKGNNIIPDRVMSLATIAADEAVEKSNLLHENFDPIKVGVVVGTSLGGMLSGDKFHSKWLTHGIDSADSTLLKQYPLYAVADILAKKYACNGSKLVISTACASGANSLGIASDLINHGLCDIVLAGGVDPLSRFTVAGFQSLGAINETVCQPYSNSKGINIGEGAAFL